MNGRNDPSRMSSRAKNLLQEMIDSNNTDIPVGEDEIGEYANHTHGALRELLAYGLVVIEGDSYKVSSTGDLSGALRRLDILLDE